MLESSKQAFREVPIAESTISDRYYGHYVHIAVYADPIARDETTVRYFATTDQFIIAALRNVGDPSDKELRKVLRRHLSMLVHIGRPPIGLDAANQLYQLDAEAEAVSVLTSILDSWVDDDTRNKAIESLGEMHKHAAPAIPRLVRLLKDGEVKWRQASALALEKIARAIPLAPPSQVGPLESAEKALGVPIQFEQLTSSGDVLDALTAARTAVRGALSSAAQVED